MYAHRVLCKSMHRTEGNFPSYYLVGWSATYSYSASIGEEDLDLGEALSLGAYIATSAGYPQVLPSRNRASSRSCHVKELVPLYM